MIRIADGGDLVCVCFSFVSFKSFKFSFCLSYQYWIAIKTKPLDQKGTGIWYEIIYITLKLKLLNDEIFQRTGLSR